MLTNNNRSSLVLTGRMAGFLYLAIIACGIFSEIFVRMKLIVTNDPILTAENILASPILFRAGFVADSMMLLSDVAIAILFYALLKSTNKTLAFMASAFRLIQASVLGMNLLNYYAALLLVEGNAYLNLISDNQIDALMMFFLDLHRHGYDLGLLFFAASNFILGHLIKKSDLFVTIFGYALQVTAFVYLVGTYCRFVFPQYMAIIEPAFFIPFIVESSFCIWLMVKGVKTGEHEICVNK